MRQSRFYARFTVLPADKLICDGRGIVVDKSVERRGRAVPGFHLYGNNLAVFLDQELDFMFVIRFIILQRVTLLEQAFRDYVFVNTAAGVPPDRVIQNGKLGLKTVHAAEQAGIIDI